MTKLIIIEGIDGSGKTTLAKELSKRITNSIFLSKKTIDANTEFQKNFMDMIKFPLWNNKSNNIDEIDEESWMYLHMLWYHMVQEFVLKRYLKSSLDYIIMDGWYYKFLARHMVNDKMNIELVLSLFSRLFKGDTVIMLDVSPNICYQRKGHPSPSECGIHKHMQKEYDDYVSFCSYQHEVSLALKSLDKYYNFKYIDASQTIDKTIENILKYV